MTIDFEDDSGYITDEPEVDSPIGDVYEEEAILPDEPIEDIPIVEELLEEGESLEDLIEKHEAYRKVRPRFPLDHLFRCGECAKEGIIGFKQISCPSCGLPLINPKNVEGTPTQRKRVRP